MSFDRSILKYISWIYKMAYREPEIHRNIMKKFLIKKDKITSPSKFNATVESLVALGTITTTKDKISLNPEIVQTGVLKTENEDFYLMTPTGKKYPVHKSVATSYKAGDILDFVVQSFDGNSEMFVLGKSQKEFQNKKADHQIQQSDPSSQNNSTTSEPIKENCLLGRVIKLSHDDLIFIPNDKKFPLRQIPISNASPAFQDRLCVMELEDFSAPILGGKIISVKGIAGNPVHEYDAIAEMHGAIMDWNDNAMLEHEISQIPTKVEVDENKLIGESQAEFMQKNHIVDLRHLPFVTVDPSDCQDMDDAIYSTFDDDGNYVCYTAVANVTKYVKPGSEIFKKYIKACFTTYAPNKAYNILPPQLATGVCSLNPNEDRLAFVVKTVIDKTTGKAKESKIYDAVIRSRQKYSYENAQGIIDALADVPNDEMKNYLEGKCLRGEQLSLEEQTCMNYLAAQKIKYAFEQRKMIRFDGNKEREIIFDKDLKEVDDIKVIPHLPYQDVIEAFMITTNEATAKFAMDHGIDIVYRVHDKPNPNKAEKTAEFFKIAGIEFDGDLSAQGTRAIIETVKGTKWEEIVNSFLIRMQSRAVYSNTPYKDSEQDYQADEEKRISHHGLQSEQYSHTTSPIRRGPDYVTKLNILAFMHDTKPLSKNIIADIIENANKMQLENDQAEKEFEDISSVFYAEKHIGESFSGKIVKIRQTSVEEGYKDDIVVIVKNDETGICAEIPLSQILGRPANDCYISEQHCAVYDGRGNIVTTLCKPIDFTIEKADRSTMTIVGRTNKTLAAKNDKKTDYRERRLPTIKTKRRTRFENKDKYNKRKATDPKEFGED